MMRKLLVGIMLVGGIGAVVTGQAGAQSQGADPVEVPLSLHGGRLIVPVMAADGTELRFFVSTGNPMTIFSESGAARMGDPAGLTLGGIPVPVDGTRTLPDENLTTDGVVLDGIIASNMLSDYNVLVDVPGGRMVLRPFGRSVEWPGMTLSEPVKLRVFHGVVLSMDVELNGNAYPAMLDLGTPNLIANTRAGAEAGLQASDVALLEVGGVTLPDLPVTIEELDMFKMWAPSGDGFVLVGAPIAWDCAVSISWIHQEMRTCVR